VSGRPDATRDPDADATELLAVGTNLGVASAAADLLSKQIALGHAAPDLVCFERVSSEQLASLRDASERLASAVVEFLDALQPPLAAGARERMALAAAEAEHVQARAHEAARSRPERTPALASPR
jgi:hypothetical protein